MLGRPERAVVAAVLLLALTGCQATLATGVQANRDGSGTVSAGLGLDADALKELGDPATELRLDDLRQAGWSVEGPRREDDGLTWVRVAKPFATADQMAVVAAELGEPFRDFRLTRARGFLTTKMAFTGVVDLTQGLAGLSDPDVQAKLGDAHLALDPDSVRDKVRVLVDVQLPGEHRSWEPPVGEVTAMSAQSETFNLVPLVPAVLAALFVVAALVVAVLYRRRT